MNTGSSSTATTGAGGATTSQPTSLPKYDVRPYRPDGGFTASGLVTMLGAMLVAGAAVGFAAHFVSKLFYLIILFPVLIGLCLGFVGARLVKFANLRNPMLGGLAGFVGGAAAMTMMHYFDYQAFHRLAEAKAPDVVAVAKMPPAQRETEYPQFEEPNEVRRLVKALDSFPGYLDHMAHEGVEIKKGTGKGLNLGYVGTYIYWLVELLIVAGITFAMVRAQTTEPFCTECALWKPYRRLGAFGGTQEVAQAGVTSGDVGAVAAAQPGAINSPLELHVAECTNCKRAGAAVKLELLSTNEKGNLERKVLAHTVWPAEAVPVLDRLFAPPPAT